MKKKPLIALVLLVMIGIIGGTIAYFTSETTFDNVFNTKPYNVTIKETFKSPDNWTPGTKTPKTVQVENHAGMNIAVRVKFDGKWEKASGGDLEVSDAGVEKDSAATLDFAADYTTNWTEDMSGYTTGYYYYSTDSTELKPLADGATTEKLLESVTFNALAKNKASCTGPVEKDGTTTVTCTSTDGGYDGAKYTLTVTVETMQYENAATAWKTA